MHAAWLLGLWYFVVARAGLSLTWSWLAGIRRPAGLRVWVLCTLGPRWTTRIIVLPGAPLVDRGPYRLLSHPNYCVVAGEILVLPLAFGLVWYGSSSPPQCLALLSVRIRRREQSALGR